MASAFPARPFASQHGSAAPSDEADMLDTEGFIVPRDDDAPNEAIELQDDDGFPIPPSSSEVAHALARAEGAPKPKVVDGGDVEAADAAIAAVQSSTAPNNVGGSKRRSSLFADRGGHTLDFANILLATRGTKKKPPKKILGGIGGSFVPKTLTAVMGPSGSGKT